MAIQRKIDASVNLQHTPAGSLVFRKRDTTVQNQSGNMTDGSVFGDLLRSAVVTGVILVLMTALYLYLNRVGWGALLSKFNLI